MKAAVILIRMKNMFVGLVSVVGLMFGGSAARASQPWLALRHEPGMHLQSLNAAHVVETTFGTNLLALPFSGTATYDFYSPTLASAAGLTTSHKASGLIVMNNSGAGHSNDFVVTGQIRFLDFNPATGTDVLIVDTAASGQQNVSSGGTTSWHLPETALTTATSVPAGHVLHVAVTITLVSGNPGGFGQLLYDGPQGQTSVAKLASETSANWNFTPTPASQQILSVQALADKSVTLTCAGLANETYTIQATTDLASGRWVTIGTNTVGPKGTFTFNDPDASKYTSRFYRTVYSSASAAANFATGQ